MRDRLIEILNKADKRCDECKQCEQCVAFSKDEDCINYLIADTLLANGVVLPPVNVGQTVWVYNQTTNNIYRNTVIGIKIFGTGKNANKIIVKYVNQRGETSDRKFAWSQIGKQVFLSEEDAVQALAERSRK